MLDLWLACYTQEEIAEAVKEPSGTIGRLLVDESFLQSVLENQMKKAAAEHLYPVKDCALAPSGLLRSSPWPLPRGPLKDVSRTNTQRPTRAREHRRRRTSRAR